MKSARHQTTASAFACWLALFATSPAPDVLALHGFLHVLGYDHETDDGTMDRLEARLRKRLLGPA